MIFQGPKGYIAQLCEVHNTHAVWKQYNKMAVLHFFLVFTLIYILFSLVTGQSFRTFKGLKIQKSKAQIRI